MKRKTCFQRESEVPAMGDFGVFPARKPLQKAQSLTFMERVHNWRCFQRLLKENNVVMPHFCAKRRILQHGVSLDFQLADVIANKPRLSNAVTLTFQL